MAAGSHLKTNNMIEMHKGQLSWIPKTVIFEGKEYPAPLNLLPIFVARTIIEYLKEKRI